MAFWHDAVGRARGLAAALRGRETGADAGTTGEGARPSRIPADHAGLDHTSFLSELAAKRGTQRYLEIGVNRGLTLSRIPARVALGVDPGFALEADVTRGKGLVVLVNETSDAFFARDDLKALLGGPPDLSFLDGMHTFEYLLRDFANTERFGTRRSLIALHDCFPLDAVMALRHRDAFRARTVGTRFQGWWTGDVWKIVPILMKYRPDLRLVAVDCFPTGLLLVTDLDPTSSVLHTRYLDIVEEARALDDGEAGLEAFYASIRLLDAATVLREFDHSLYLRV